MFSLRDVFIFLAGGQFFHTLSHILLPYFIQLPVVMMGINITPELNNWAIAINGLIALAFLWGAKKAS